MFFHRAASAVHSASDFVGQSLIPKLPVEASRDLFSDNATSAPEFALDGDDSNHS
jgi:hypothetical protein